MAVNQHQDESWLEAGQQHFQARRYPEAVAAYRQAISIAPTSAPAYYHLGEVLARLQKKKQAVAAFERATVLDPAFTAAYLAKGRQLRALGWHRQALAAFEQAVRLEPQQVAAWYQLGSTLRTLKRYQEALATYERMLALAPDQERTYLALADVFQALGQEEEGLATLERGIARLPASGLLWRHKAQVLQDRHQPQEALAVYEQLIQLDPEDEHAYLAKGQLLWSLGCYEEAGGAYQGFIRFGCCFDCAWRVLHQTVLRETALLAEAQIVYDHLIAQDPNPLGASLSKGEVLADLGQHAQAQQAYERAVELCDQTLAQEPTGYAYAMKAIALRALGRTAEATVASQTAQALRGQGRFLPERYGRLLHRLGAALERYAECLDLGIVTTPPLQFHPPHGDLYERYLAPDLAFVRTEQVQRLPALGAQEAQSELPIAPDLAVAVVLYDQPKALARRAHSWLRSGVQLVWVVRMDERQVDVWRAETAHPATTLGGAEALNGEAILPGFQYSLAALFDAEQT